MISRYIHFVLVFIVFGIGAGIRYVFFFLIGKSKKYDDLIAPSSQDKWNIIVSFTIVVPIIFLISKYGTSLENRHPPIEYLFR